jgi:hypothetical protein
MNNHETLSIITLALIFGVYAWTATLEFGVALLRLLPKWDATNMATKLTQPFWEISNGVLALGCIGVASIFDTRISEVATDLVPTLLVGLLAVVARAALLMYVSYHPRRSVIMDALFATMSFMVPATMAAVGIYLVTGQAFWVTMSGWIFMLMSLALIKVTALAFVYWHAKDTADHRLQWATRMGVGVFAVLAAVAAQLVVREDSPHLISLPFGVLVVLVASTVLWQGALLTTKRADHGIWWYLSLIIIALPVCLALANAPWLGYAHFKVTQIYDADGFAAVMYAGLFSLLITAVIVAGGRRRLARRLPRPAKKKTAAKRRP